MRPVTPELDQVVHQLLMLLRWWMDQAWWHSGIVLLAILLVMYGLAGGAAFMCEWEERTTHQASGHVAACE